MNNENSLNGIKIYILYLKNKLYSQNKTDANIYN